MMFTKEEKTLLIVAVLLLAGIMVCAHQRSKARQEARELRIEKAQERHPQVLRPWVQE